MNAIDLLVADLESSVPMLAWHLGDFSDADMFVRPVPGANHTAWQIGHLANGEAQMMNMAFPNSVTLPAGWSDQFGKSTCTCDDATKFPSKQTMLETLTNVRAQTIAAARKLQPADLEKPTGIGFAPTVAKLMVMHSVHTAMHMGQVQVIRRKLGKPNLF